MSDISPFGQRCARCQDFLTTRDYLRDNIYCSKCKIEIEAEEFNQLPGTKRRSSRIREHRLKAAEILMKEEPIKKYITRKKEEKEPKNTQTVIESIEEQAYFVKQPEEDFINVIETGVFPQEEDQNNKKYILINKRNTELYEIIPKHEKKQSKRRTLQCQ
ncbi:hypothetical protein EDI_201600 [Entamoeba dispar SAW760]|uniref:Uncharacterized protein n=1 Tax=Entamoeba dispar (strain ATCC PRA-260 / SAW760) TaxID=370354 RepID=B0ETY7_ENTDS|nr:uncharacterized protein EDI_201600 [Entamoeba dispar SAW760]EDR22044.1 hypothetical protein EDI_201600 [Entamoeba dispar SAW760]|eukprot:EDR22044.1 hypothetical protein EDI_201600 [Entamoeba dispar SAW760]